MNLGTERIAKDNLLAVVVERTQIAARNDIDSCRAIPGSKSRLIFDQYRIVAGCQRIIAKGKVNTIGKANKVQINRRTADIGQLDKLEIFIGQIRIAGCRHFRRRRIGWMVHQFGDTQVLQNRTSTINFCVHRAPTAAILNTRLDTAALV